MGRWSPTVVAEATPVRRSALTTALGVGMDVYRQRRNTQLAEDQERRMQQQADDEAEWRDEQRAAREMEATRQAERDRRSAEVDAFNRSTRMTGDGWLTNEPEEPAEDYFNVDDPTIRAANTGFGGPESDAIPRWYAEGKEAIHAEAKSRFGGTGTVKQVDPTTGQAYYLPVRRQFVDSQMAALDKRLAEERAARAKATTDRDKFDYELAARLKSDKDRLAYAASLRRTPGSEDEDDPIASEFRTELSGLDKQLDDTRAGISAAGTRGTLADKISDMHGLQEASADATSRQALLSELEKKRGALVNGGLSGYRQQRSQKDLAAGMAELNAIFGDAMNDKNIPEFEKQKLRVEFQRRADLLVNQAQKTAPKSPLSRAMGAGR